MDEYFDEGIKVRDGSVFRGNHKYFEDDFEVVFLDGIVGELGKLDAFVVFREGTRLFHSLIFYEGI